MAQPRPAGLPGEGLVEGRATRLLAVPQPFESRRPPPADRAATCTRSRPAARCSRPSPIGAFLLVLEPLLRIVEIRFPCGRGRIRRERRSRRRAAVPRPFQARSLVNGPRVPRRHPALPRRRSARVPNVRPGTPGRATRCMRRAAVRAGDSPPELAIERATHPRGHEPGRVARERFPPRAGP